jgi:hypothetical protein
MSKLTDLVPPLELCKLIPEGEFAESLCIWVNGLSNQPKVILRPWDKKCIACPAPTTDEILDKCKDIQRVLNPTLWWQGTWKADCAINNSDKLIEECLEDADFNDLDIVETQDDNAATAALRLWLKLKGIEDGE